MVHLPIAVWQLSAKQVPSWCRTMFKPSGVVGRGGRGYAGEVREDFQVFESFNCAQLLQGARSILTNGSRMPEEKMADCEFSIC